MGEGAIVNSFLIPVLCGYLLIQAVPKLQLAVLAHSENGYRLIMRSLVYGLVYMYLIVIFVDLIDYVYLCANSSSADCNFYKIIMSVDFVKTTEKIFLNKNFSAKYVFCAFFLSLILWRLNRSVLSVKTNKSLEKLEEEFLCDNGDHFIRKIIDAQNSFHFIILTLKSRKVYIGCVAKRPRLLSNVGRKSLILYPLKSGYRDKDCLEIKITNIYWLYFEVMHNQEKIDNFFKQNPDKMYEIEIIIDKTYYESKFNKSEYEELKYKFGVTIEWDEIESIISYIPVIEGSVIK